jgi:RNA polymerase sigma factor (TIGR02999 family)
MASAATLRQSPSTPLRGKCPASRTGKSVLGSAPPALACGDVPPMPDERNPEMNDAPRTADGGAAGRDAAELADAYARLRRIAQRLMTYERVGHTLSATDIVHEAMARLLENEGWRAEEMTAGPKFVEFVQHAAHSMQQVLVDHARRRGAVKRGGGRRRVDVNDVELALDAPEFDWLTLNEALEEMRRHDSRRHSVVLLRFFGGLDNRQIAHQLGVDERTVGRDWSSAKLWLRKRLTDVGSENT